VKIIRDLVHGYIEVDDLEMKIIDTPNFQRLKDIRQLTCQQAYPSANHTRFEHSLGVLHLAKKALHSLWPQLNNRYKLNVERFKEMLLHLRLAALLHDVGHAPYSHLGEKYFRVPEIKEKIGDLIKKYSLSFDESIFNKGSPHELMSCFVILDKYLSIIEKSTPQKVDFELICRAIVGAKYSNREDKWIQNIIIELLNSDTIDIDKLDYLMRDSLMTGVTVPEIDTTRLFLNITIHPQIKSVTFNSKAIPVIQNIIDARDSLYLWVYNHHIAVYMDFVTEFYIKHMAANFEARNKYKDKIDLYKLFSCHAISDLLVSDSDLRSVLKNSIELSHEEKSKYTVNIIPQLFYRHFLKPLWKTIYEYREFMLSYLRDSRLRKEFERKMCQEDITYRRYVAKQIIKECNLNLGQIFIVPRSNKFYSLDPEKNIFHVFVGSGDRDIRELLPQKDFRELYQNVSFYVFGVQDKLDLIKDKLVEIMKKPLPDKEKLLQDATELKWFRYK